MMVKRIVSVGVACLALVAAAMPTKKELKDVSRLVNELMSGDLQSYKAGRMKASEVAANAEAYARDAETEAAKFLLLKGAFGFYMQGEDYGEALRVLNELTTTVKDIPDRVVAEIVVAKLKKVSKNKGTAVFEYYERLNQRMTMSEERAKLEKALKENPKSKEAHHDLAVCLAVLGDWKGALAHFAQAGGKEAEAAKLEGSGKRVGAADLWWDLAQGDAADVFKAHAAELYQQAIADGKLTGLKLTLVKKRIAEVRATVVGADHRAARPDTDGSVGADHRAARPDTDGSVGADHRAARSDAARPDTARPSTPRNGKIDWTIPANFKEGTVRTVDLDVGCPEKMTFFAISPGECDMLRLGSCRVTRPFWLAQFPVTVAQYKALGFESQTWNLKKLVEACKDDPTVAAIALVNNGESEKFYETMNQMFGALLPKGLVFRPCTVAESRRLSIKDLIYHSNQSDRARDRSRQLAAFQKKGFYTDCKTWQEMEQMQWKLGEGDTDRLRVVTRALLIDYDRIRATHKMADVLLQRSFLLDTISTPDLGPKKSAHDPQVRDGIIQLLSGSMKTENPFWYCEKGAPARRVSMGVTTFQDASGWQRVCVLRVAVGYDYVGEWKRTHGK